MSAVLIIGGLAMLALAIIALAISRRRIRASRENNWTNRAYLAREATGSWTENECAVGHEDPGRPAPYPGVS
jgi:hypothetical protein